MVDQLFSLLSRPCSISSAAYLYPVDGGIARYSRQVQRAISVENRPAGGCDERTTSWKTEQMSSCLNSRPVSPLFSTGCCCVSCCPFSYHPPPFCCYHSSYFAPMCFSPLSLYYFNVPRARPCHFHHSVSKFWGCGRRKVLRFIRPSSGLF